MLLFGTHDAWSLTQKFEYMMFVRIHIDISKNCCKISEVCCKVEHSPLRATTKSKAELS